MMDIKQTIYDFDESSDVYFLVNLIVCGTYRYAIKGPRTMLSNRENLVVGNKICVKCDNIIRKAFIVHMSTDISYLLNLKKKLTSQFRKGPEYPKRSNKCTGKHGLHITNATKKLYKKYTAKRSNLENDVSIIKKKETDVFLQNLTTNVFSKISFKSKKDYIKISSDEDESHNNSNNLFGLKNIFSRSNVFGDVKAPKTVKIAEDYNLFVVTKDMCLYIINYEDIITDISKIKLLKSLWFRTENGDLKQATLIFISTTLEEFNKAEIITSFFNTYYNVGSERMQLNIEEVSPMMKESVEMRHINTNCLKINT